MRNKHECCNIKICQIIFKRGVFIPSVGSSDQHGTEKVHPAPVLEEHLESEALEGSQMSIHLKNEENYRPVAKYGGLSSLI